MQLLRFHCLHDTLEAQAGVPLHHRARGALQLSTIQDSRRTTAELISASRLQALETVFVPIGIMAPHISRSIPVRDDYQTRRNDMNGPAGMTIPRGLQEACVLL